ncbi:hypothetical protein D3C87_1519840 [compost metagenome]
MKCTISTCNNSCFFMTKLITMTIWAVDNRNTPASSKSFYIWQNILNSRSKNQFPSFKIISTCCYNFKSFWQKFYFYYLIFMKLYGFILSNLFLSYRCNLQRSFSILCQKVMGIRCLSITGYSTINDEHISQRTP